MKKVTVYGESSFRLKNKHVEAFVTPRGGHLAPVNFRIGNRTVQPYALAPWKPGGIDKGLPPILHVLRGDFFCLTHAPKGHFRNALLSNIRCRMCVIHHAGSDLILHWRIDDARTDTIDADIVSRVSQRQTSAECRNASF